MCNNAKAETLINDNRELTQLENGRVRVMRLVRLYRYQSLDAPDVYVLEQRTYKEQGDWDRTISESTRAFPVHYPSSQEHLNMLRKAIGLIESPFSLAELTEETEAA